MAQYLVKVFILPKPDVLDPQGKAVMAGLISIGFNEVQDTRIGKYIEIMIETENSESIEKRISEMCDKLLANTVIENYSFEVIAS
jgi:phosphoribosylformylglycinamidine synthase